MMSSTHSAVVIKSVATEGSDQMVRMQRTICAFDVVRMWYRFFFPRSSTFKAETNKLRQKNDPVFLPIFQYLEHFELIVENVIFHVLNLFFRGLLKSTRSFLS